MSYGPNIFQLSIPHMSIPVSWFKPRISRAKIVPTNSTLNRPSLPLRNNSIVTGIIHAAKMPPNIRANAMRRATERMYDAIKPTNTRRRARKSKVNTRRRR